MIDDLIITLIFALIVAIIGVITIFLVDKSCRIYEIKEEINAAKRNQ